MFLILLHYENGLDLVDQHLAAHASWLRRNYEKGRFLLSGRRHPRNGGVILCRAGSRAEVDVLVSEDPFASTGAARHEIVEFLPGDSSPELSFLLPSRRS